jgi:predicted protein tyrosine phosphatase
MRLIVGMTNSRDYKFHIMGREEAIRFTLSRPYIHIAVYTPGDCEVPLTACENRKGDLQLCFHDLARVSDREWLANQLKGTGVKMTPFSKEQAEQIVRFLDQHAFVRDIAVNCDAGMCRSPAIAAAISKFFTGDDERFYMYYRPNHHVFRGLLSKLEELHQ